MNIQNVQKGELWLYYCQKYTQVKTTLYESYIFCLVTYLEISLKWQIILKCHFIFSLKYLDKDI